jgi:hypothetical protein
MAGGSDTIPVPRVDVGRFLVTKNMFQLLQEIVADWKKGRFTADSSMNEIEGHLAQAIEELQAPEVPAEVLQLLQDYENESSHPVSSPTEGVAN